MAGFTRIGKGGRKNKPIINSISPKKTQGVLWVSPKPTNNGKPNMTEINIKGNGWAIIDGEFIVTHPSKEEK